jgi:hypothetical protein
MIEWIKTVQGIAAIVALIFATVVAWWNLGLAPPLFSPVLAPVHRRIEVARTIRPGHPAPGSSTRPWWSANPLGMLWPEMDPGFVTSGGGNGGPPTVARRPVVITAGS